MKAVWILVLILALAAAQWFRPLPQVSPVLDGRALAARAARVPRTAPPAWPSTGEAAVAVAGVGSFGAVGGERALPIASLAKIMTALLVLRRLPLPPGADGPTFTVTPADVAVYQRDKAGQQSVVKVVAGERLTERELLQALLLPSANNVATLLARRLAGSEQAFVRLMNEEARKLGLRHTHFADASGVSPATVSTAGDLLRLTEVAMRDPTFAGIVAEPQATLPVAGTVYNVNAMLGKHGIVGVKTGSTQQAGGCFAFAAKLPVAGKTRSVLGVVLAQQGLSILAAALKAGVALAHSAASRVRPFTLLTAGSSVGTLSAPWARPIPVVVARSVRLLGFSGLTLSWHVRWHALGQSVRRGEVVGELRLALGEQRVVVPLTAAGTLSPPSARWRLTRL